MQCEEKYDNCSDDHVCNNNQVYLNNACRRTCKTSYDQKCDSKKHESGCMCPEEQYETEMVSTLGNIALKNEKLQLKKSSNKYPQSAVWIRIRKIGISLYSQVLLQKSG